MLATNLVQLVLIPVSARMWRDCAGCRGLLPKCYSRNQSAGSRLGGLGMVSWERSSASWAADRAPLIGPARSARPARREASRASVNRASASRRALVPRSRWFGGAEGSATMTAPPEARGKSVPGRQCTLWQWTCPGRTEKRGHLRFTEFSRQLLQHPCEVLAQVRQLPRLLAASSNCLP